MKTPEQIAGNIVYQHGGNGLAAFQNIIRGIEADRAERASLDVDYAIDAWASAYAGMWDMAESFHRSLNYSEAKALANLLVLADRHDLAIKLMEGWAEHDPEMAQEPERAAALAAYLAERREHLRNDAEPEQ